MPEQKPMWTRPPAGFSVMWVTKLLISPVKKRIFCPKTTKFGPKLAFLVKLGQAMQAYSVPCWWVGWWLWRAGCISQDTYLLYFIDKILNFETLRKTIVRRNCLVPGAQDLHSTTGNYPSSRTSSQSLEFRLPNLVHQQQYQQNLSLLLSETFKI